VIVKMSEHSIGDGDGKGLGEIGREKGGKKRRCEDRAGGKVGDWEKENV